jgi:hypothetical protein
MTFETGCLGPIARDLGKGFEEEASTIDPRYTVDKDGIASAI